MDLDLQKIPKDEGDYLEMVAHLKQLYDEITQKCSLLENKEKEYKKIIMTVYGLSRVIDTICDSCFEVPPELNILIETLRAFCSDNITEHIL